jgi:hypothetical protein
MVPRTRDRDRPTEDDDTDDSEAPSEDSEEQDDPTPDLSERDRTVEDLAADDGTDVRQQVVSGSRANFDLDPKFNPGFTDTEVVNRIGMVLSLNCSYDYQRGVWVGEPIDKTERQAVEQTLAEDRATDDLTDPAEPGDGSTVDDNGDLRLEKQIEGNSTVGNDSPNELTATGRYGLVLDAEVSASSFSVNMTFGATPPSRMRIRDTATDRENVYLPVTGEDMVVDYSIEPAGRYVITLDNDGNSWSPVEFPNTTDPQDIPLGTCEGGQSPGGTGSVNVHTIKKIGNGEVVEEAEAKSSFDNPCKATSTRSTQYDVCSRSGDVQVDLYNGDPDDPDSTLLARDIDQREDISDLPDAFTDLQYRIRLTRAPDGSSPKVSRLGHQIIR